MWSKIQNYFDSTLELLKLVRYWEWTDKIQMNCLAILILFFLRGDVAGQYGNIIVFLIYVHFPFCFGYLLNSYTDREKDLKVGKDNFGQYSQKFIKIILSVFFGLSLLVPLYFHNRAIFLLTMLGVLVTAAYSLKPLRLKERGLIGLVIAAAAQRLPFLFFAFLLPEYKGSIIYIFIWLLLLSFVIETAHQVGDHLRDKVTKTKTFSQKIGKKKSVNLIYGEILCLLVYSILPIIVFSSIPFGKRIALFLVLIIFSQEAILYALQQAWPQLHLKKLKIYKNW